MKRILPLLFLFIFASCGQVKKIGSKMFDQKTSPAQRQFSTSGAEFDAYIAQFEAEGKTRLDDPTFTVGDIPINFGNAEGFAGICISYKDGSKEIIIDRDAWKSKSGSYAAIIIYHELGHCRLGHDHDDRVVEYNQQQIKTSIMNSVLLAPLAFDDFKDGYLTELYTKDRTLLLNALN